MTPVGEPWCRWHIPHVYFVFGVGVNGALTGIVFGVGPDDLRLGRLRQIVRHLHWSIASHLHHLPFAWNDSSCLRSVFA
jgi:hypothetical protein